MRARGVNIEIPEEGRDCEPLIIRTGDEHTTMVFDPKRGSSAVYTVWVMLVAKEPITLLGCEIASEFDDQIVVAGLKEQGQFYNFGGREFPKRDVLNPRLESRLSLRRGQMIEGLILASGLHPIPAQYSHGARLACNLIFIDQYGNEIRHNVALFVDRTWQSKRPAAPRPKGSLYGGLPQCPSYNFIMEWRARQSQAASLGKPINDERLPVGIR
jgi:hypothetical protein